MNQDRVMEKVSVWYSGAECGGWALAESRVRGKKFALVLAGVVLAGQAAVASLGEPKEVVELEPFQVVTTATRTERLAVDLPIRTEVLGSEMFQAAGVFDLSGAMEYLPGVRVETNCQNCGTAEVMLLGLGAGYNQLLFNGQPMFSGLAAVYGLEHIPTAFIDRVEVVKGGASTLYGPGAVTGVINIIPREPLASGITTGAAVESFSGDIMWRLMGLGDWVAADRTSAVTVFSEAREQDAVDLSGDGFSDITKRSFRTAGTQFWHYPAEGMRLTGNYALITEKRRGGDSFDLPPHEAQITEQLEHMWHRGGLQLQHNVTRDFSYWLTGSVSHIERDSYYGGVGDVALPGQEGFDPDEYAEALEEAELLYGFTRTTRYFAELVLVNRFAKRALTWGSQFQYDDVFDEKRNVLNQSLTTTGELATRRGEDPIADGSFHNWGFFVQDEWDPTPDWTVISGVRADRHSELDKWILSPRAAVRYSPAGDWALRASVATGFRAPEIFDEDFHIEILEDPTRVRNADGLREERSVSYATGFVWTPSRADGRLQLDFELYHTELRDTFQVSDIVFVDTDGNAFKLRENAGKAKVQGFEWNVRYAVSEQLSVMGGITFTHAVFREPVEILEDQFERRFLQSPRWSGMAQVFYSPVENVDVFIGLNYTGPMLAVNQEEEFINTDTGHFFVVDVSVGRRFSWSGVRDLAVVVGVRNLFDQRQSDLSTGPERDAGYVYGPRAPRSFFLSTQVRF